MSESHMPHLDDAQLLRFCDGELPPREASRIERHLEACWECRTLLEDIQKTINSYIHYRKETLQAQLPPPPKPWGDIRSQLNGGPGPRPASFPRLVYAVAAAAVVCVIVYRFNSTPSVRAAELLQKAVAAEHQSTSKIRQVRIRTRTRTVTRADSADLQALFASAHYSWENPLSAESYTAWHNQLTDKRDSVSTFQDSYQIRTTTSSGNLAEATIQFRKEDLRPVAETLQFRNQEWVEISEASESPAPAAPQPSRPDIKELRRAAEPAPVTPGDELKVIAALHGIGADLGDPIEIVRGAGRIVVTGTGLTPERAKQIQTSLEQLPNVELHFSTPEPARSPPVESRRQIVSGDTPLETHLRDRLGGAEAYSKFADHVREQSDAMMARAHALRKLAERFAPETEAQLSIVDRRLLASLRIDHAEVFFHEAGEIEKSMKPVLAEIGAQAPPQSSPAQGSWQSATQQLWTSAQDTDRMLGMFLAGHGGSGSPQTPAAVAKALAQLEAEAASYRQVTEAARMGH
jgi:hypothetical protein